MRRFFLFLAPAATLLGSAAPAAAASVTVATSVNINKPVLLSKIQDMDFGTVTLSGFTGTRAVTISQAGVLSCGTNLVCSGIAKPARFNVQGSNNNTVLISYSGGVLSNGVSGSETIAFAPIGPTSMAITNSGAPGTNFDVGGTLTLTPTLAGGTYTGTMTVTADYQ